MRHIRAELFGALTKSAAGLALVCLMTNVCDVLAAQPTLADNPYVSLPPGTVEAFVNAALFGAPGADATIENLFLEHPGMPAAQRAVLEDRLCGDYYAHSAYRAMVTACANAAANGIPESKSTIIGNALLGTPPIRVIGSATVPLQKNALGSRDVTVTVTDVSAPWIVDTGAQISVISESLAERLHLEPLAGDISVGSVTGTDVSGHIAVIAEMQIGDAFVRNVPVLIEPDSQLKIADLAQIQGVLGLPVLVAFRRVAWLHAGQSLSLGDAAPLVPDSNLKIYWHDEGIGIPVSSALGTEGAHFDTGSNEGYLWTPAHLLLDAQTEATAVDHIGRLGGAAGVIETKEKLYKEIRLDVAGVPMSFPGMTLTERKGEGAGRFGDDVLQQLNLLVLDFENMRILAKSARN